MGFVQRLQAARARVTLGRSTSVLSFLTAAVGGFARRPKTNGVEEALRSEFDPSFYLQRYPGLPAGVDPLRHYVSTGWREGRDPCEWFSTTRYLELNPDVGASGVNPFYHYVCYGRAEKRAATPASAAGAIDLHGERPRALDGGASAASAGRGAWPRKRTFLANLLDGPMHVEKPETLMAAVDRGYALGDAGLLVFGWYFTPKRKPFSVSVCDEKWNKVSLDGRINILPRVDVANGYRPRFPDLDEMCGFVCLAPMPTRPGEFRALSFDFGELGETWLRVPTEVASATGTTLAKEILGLVLSPDRARHRLHDVFENGLGAAIEIINQTRPPLQNDVQVVQHGTPPEHPVVTVVVPLYGRFDFLRHQLAHFADDEDFRTVDLIYVVDDPRILPQTLELAARYHPLFRIPFRIVSYGENRGFAGANNIGARLARGATLMLLNSDVLPQHPGWLSTLRSALDDLPDAGAVGPLLQFGDGSIQHAGMYPRTNPLWPGFLLNIHRQMGTAWSGGVEPVERPMLTAACLMLRTRDFADLGGFDEGYMIGDFEDSDLCLSLRKRGRRLWLVPKAALWHLERQSQTLDIVPSSRQMITLFNAWRYGRKIRSGELADPMLLEIAP